MTRMLGKAEAHGLAKKLQRRWYRWRLAFTIIPARHNGIWCGRIYPAKTGFFLFRRNFGGRVR